MQELDESFYKPHHATGDYDNERIIANTLEKCGLNFTGEERGVENGRCLDFHLTDHNVFIEVKSGYSERSNEQLKSQMNVILIQGMQAAKMFSLLLCQNLPKK